MQPFINLPLSPTSVRRFLFRSAVIALFLSAFDTSAADFTAEWVGTGYGDWPDAANWKDGIVPANDLTNRYNVIIDRTDTADFIQCALLTQQMEVSQLTLGETLYVYVLDPAGWGGFGSPEFDVRDRFHWTGGSLSGWSARYHLFGPALFDGLTVKTLDRECTLNIHDQATWTQGNLGWGGYGVVTVEPSGVFSISTGGLVGSSGSTDSVDLYNKGIIRMDADGKIVTFFTPMHNSGTIDVKSGELQLTGYDGSGDISIQAGSRAVVAGTGKWQGGRQFGEGELVLNGGQVVMSNTIFSCFTRIVGPIAADAQLVVSNSVWESGKMSGNGGLMVPPAGIMNITGQSPELSCNALNQGDISLAPGALLFGAKYTTLTNATDAVIHLSSASSLGVFSWWAGSLLNQGQILKDDGGVGQADIVSVLQNYGCINSSAGRLTLQLGGTNFGRFEATSPGSIEAHDVVFSDTASLGGNGLISLFGGSLCGSVDKNANLQAGGLNILGSNCYTFSTFQVIGQLRFKDSGTVNVAEHLALNAGLSGGKLNSLQSAELAFASSAEIAGGAQLDLRGDSTVTQGLLTIKGTNSFLLNSGALHTLGAADILVNSGGAFINTGHFGVNRRIGSFSLGVTDTFCHILATNLSPFQTIEEGDFKISGPVNFAPGEISARSGAQLTFSDVSLTNATVKLSQSSLEAKSSSSWSNAILVLDKGTIIAPHGVWTGSVSLAGEGSIEGSLTLGGLKLNAVPGMNDLTINGSVALTGGTNGNFVAALTLVSNAPVFPHLTVHGPVVLDSKFTLSSSFAPNASNFVLGPITILESDQPITGKIVGATNGAVLPGSNNFYFTVFYGTNSPFGPNKVVIADFGSSFDLWRIQRFSPDELQAPLISGPNAHRGPGSLDNLTQFVLAIDPTNGANQPYFMPDPEGYTYLRVCKRKYIGGLTARIAVSSDLLKWQETVLGSSQSSLLLYRAFEFEDHYEYRYRYMGTPSSLFLRFVVGGQY